MSDSNLELTSQVTQERIAETLINAGANVNTTAKKLVSPLHEAVRLRNVGIAKLLLEDSANKQLTDHEGKRHL